MAQNSLKHINKLFGFHQHTSILIFYLSFSPNSITSSIRLKNLFSYVSECLYIGAQTLVDPPSASKHFQVPDEIYKKRFLYHLSFPYPHTHVNIHIWIFHIHSRQQTHQYFFFLLFYSQQPCGVNWAEKKWLDQSPNLFFMPIVGLEFVVSWCLSQHLNPVFFSWLENSGNWRTAYLQVAKVEKHYLNY